MQTYDGRTMRYRALSVRNARWMMALQAAMVAIVLIGLPLRANAMPAAQAAQTHVYLMRGVLNIFSLGMDQMAYRLQAQGINASVHNHMLWSSVAADAAAAYKSGKIKTIILVGHSSGATCLPDIVASLSAQGVPVKLAIGLDSVFKTKLSTGADRYINLYIGNGPGEPVRAAAGLRGRLDNVDVQSTGVGHISIDKNDYIQRRVISEIDAVVLRARAPAEPNGPKVNARSAAAMAPARN